MHKNNFDFLRLLFAILVIMTHAYPISGLKEEDVLFHMTGGQALLSHIGVSGFFVISGFLIYQSLCRSKSLFLWLWGVACFQGPVGLVL